MLVLHCIGLWMFLVPTILLLPATAKMVFNADQDLEFSQPMALAIFGATFFILMLLL